jgi:lipoate synthase
VVITAQNRKICLLQGTKNLAAIVTEIRQQKPSVTIVGKLPDGA